MAATASYWDPLARPSLQEVYKALEPLRPGMSEVRMLELLPGRGDEPKRCTMCITSLDQNLHYEALSYTWQQTASGGDIPNYPLFVNDVTAYILPSLSSALQNLRFPHKPRKLWIDYLCINQADFEERNTQMQLMGRIYKTAWRVLCFLGEANSSTAEAMQLLSDLTADNKHIPSYFM